MVLKGYGGVCVVCVCVRATGVEPLYLDPNMVGWIKLCPNQH